MPFWVYVLRCTDGSYYTGHTDNLESRLGQHNTGAIVGCYTFRRRPLTLAFSQEFVTRGSAGAERTDQGLGPKRRRP